MVSSTRHIPVMLAEVLESLKPQSGKTYVDATFGNGGYSEAILNHAACNVIAIDRDPTVQLRAEELRNQFGKRFVFIPGTFGNLAHLINARLDGIVFDIGVSSMQLDEASRGFSFTKEAPLDMRMSCQGISAAQIVNTWSEKDLADLIYKYGEERKSRQIAYKIITYRKSKPIETTTELANIIYSVIHKSYGTIDPATRTFQALRIAVNEELEELRAGLKAAADLLNPGGRLVVVDFHSLEDRVVKTFFNEFGGKRTGVSRYLPDQEVQTPLLFDYVSKPMKPSATECHDNPRARSAKLRYAIKSKQPSLQKHEFALDLKETFND